MPRTALTKRLSQVRVSQNHDETFDTLSTAALPPSYTITLARPVQEGSLDDEQKADEYRRGQEYLNDGIRRVKDKEGELTELIHAIKRRKLSSSQAGAEDQSGALDRDVFWYTASLRHACSCDLESLSRSFKPRRPPPPREDLSDLSPLVDTSEVVLIGEDLPQWATVEDYTDLEPGLDGLQEFEPGWRDATGAIWESQGIGKFCDALDSDAEEFPNAGSIAVMETPESRWLRKGKFKAIEHLGHHPLRHEIPDTPAQVQVQDVVLDTPYPPVRTAGEKRKAEQLSQQEKMDWEKESKRRKQLWRGLIGQDSGYGQFWETLTRPHSYSNLLDIPDQVRPPDYNLFRNYHTATHPYHPDLSRYITRNPQGRLYWLIPIHGPVIIPKLNDEAMTSTTRTAEREVPIPSSATFHLDTPAPLSSGKVSRPAPVAWTGPLLNHFVQSFLLPLRQSRLYGLSIAFSGPKPDPFIALVPAAPLLKHLNAGKSRSRKDDLSNKTVGDPISGSGADQDKARLNGRPVRVEAGDHVRVYCDASEALSLRTWLYGIHVDLDGEAAAVAASKSSKGRRLFDKVRLCLIGQRGEVLIVA